MDEQIHVYTTPIADSTGRLYRAAVIGQERGDGTWEARLRFSPLTPGVAVVETERETTQPNQADLEYWAGGVEVVYLEGALGRARELSAGAVRGHANHEKSPAPAQQAILDPFAVYAQGESVLRKELGALSIDHLRSIVQEYGFRDIDLTLSRGTIADLIVAEVHRRKAGGA